MSEQRRSSLNEAIVQGLERRRSNLNEALTNVIDNIALNPSQKSRFDILSLFCTKAQHRSVVLGSVIAIFSMTFYVVDTLRLSNFINNSENNFHISVFIYGSTGIILLFDYIALGFKEAWRLPYLLTPLSLADLSSSFPVTIMSAYFVWGLDAATKAHNCQNHLCYRVLNTIHVLTVLRLFKLLRVTAMINDEATRRAYSFLIQITSLVMVFSAIIASLEDISFPEAFYFSIVSITTVGFGDVAVTTPVARLTVIALLLTTMIMIPMASHNLFQQHKNLNSSNSQNPNTTSNAITTSIPSGMGAERKMSSAKQMNSKRRTGSHIILCGSINTGLYKFFEEYFHSDHGLEKKSKVILISNDMQAKLALRMVSHSLERAHLLRFLPGMGFQGSILERAGLRNAKAIYILGSDQTHDADSDDRQTLLIAFAAFERLKSRLSVLSAFLSENANGPLAWDHHEVHCLDMYIKVLTQRSRKTLEELLLRDETRVLKDHVNILCVEETKMQILANSCLCPGFSTFISNLCRSVSSRTLEIIEADTNTGEQNVCEISWYHEYIHGAAYEIYQVPLGTAFTDLTFSELALIMYEEIGVLVIGVSLEIDKNVDAQVLLNPGKHSKLNPQNHRVKVFVIAQDRTEAEIFTIEAAPVKLGRPAVSKSTIKRALSRQFTNTKRTLAGTTKLAKNFPNAKMFARKSSRLNSAKRLRATLRSQSAASMGSFNGRRTVSSENSNIAPEKSSSTVDKQDLVFENLAGRIRRRVRKALDHSHTIRPGDSLNNSGKITSESKRIITNRETGFKITTSPKNADTRISNFNFDTVGVEKYQTSSFKGRDIGVPLMDELTEESTKEAITVALSEEETTNVVNTLDDHDNELKVQDSATSLPLQHQDDTLSLPSQPSFHKENHQLFGVSKEILGQRYAILDQPVQLQDVIVKTLLRYDFPHVKEHIILYAEGSDCSEFILQVRKHRHQGVIPVVILTRNPLRYQTWLRICHFPQVYIVEGPAQLVSTWHRAGVRFASHVILAATPCNHEGEEDNYASEGNADSGPTFKSRGGDEDTLFLYNLINRENRRVRISCVLQNPTNVKFMHRSTDVVHNISALDPGEQIMMFPSVASGTVLCGDLFDTIMAQTNYNPHLLRVLQLLLCGGSLADQLNQGMLDSRFFAVDVTLEMSERTYGEVFAIFCSYGILPVCLTRGTADGMLSAPMGNSQSYVVTNPIAATPLFEGDIVCCLSHDEPVYMCSIPELGIKQQTPNRSSVATCHFRSEEYSRKHENADVIRNSDSPTNLINGGPVENCDKDEKADKEEKSCHVNTSSFSSTASASAFENCRTNIHTELEAFRSMLASFQSEVQTQLSEQSLGRNTTDPGA